jgi:hypothetical protein
MSVTIKNLDLQMLNRRLPDDVLRHIYEEYVVGIETCNRYLKMYESDEARKLDHKQLIEPTRRLLKHPCAVEYLCKKHKTFEKMYIEHYVVGKKWFVQMNMLESFILSILMWLYH